MANTRRRNYAVNVDQADGHAEGAPGEQPSANKHSLISQMDRGRVDLAVSM
jgi:hypothetical protein